jgi:hypothetical protein
LSEIGGVNIDHWHFARKIFWLIGHLIDSSHLTNEKVRLLTNSLTGGIFKLFSIERASH